MRRLPVLSRDGRHPLPTSFITLPGRTRSQSFPRREEEGRVPGPFPPPPVSQPVPTRSQASTFVQDRPKDGQAVIYGGTVPAASPELMLTLLDAQFHAFRYTGHDLDVVAAETQLLGDQARDGAAEQRLGGQRRVLLAQGQGPAGRQWGWHCRYRTRGPVWMSYLPRGWGRAGWGVEWSMAQKPGTSCAAFDFLGYRVSQKGDNTGLSSVPLCCVRKITLGWR